MYIHLTANSVVIAIELRVRFAVSFPPSTPETRFKLDFFSVPTPTLPSLPFCAAFQFSRDSIRAFNDGINSLNLYTIIEISISFYKPYTQALGVIPIPEISTLIGDNPRLGLPPLGREVDRLDFQPFCELVFFVGRRINNQTSKRLEIEFMEKVEMDCSSLSRLVLFSSLRITI